MIKIPWQHKPHRGIQLNKSHPLVRGLTGCYVMNEATGEKVFDLAGNNDGAFTNAPTWSPFGITFDATTENISTELNTENYDEITYVFAVKKTVTGTGYVFKCGNNYFFTGTAYCRFKVGSVNVQGDALTLNERTTYVCTIDSGNVGSLYTNGIFDNSGTDATWANSTPLLLGNYATNLALFGDLEFFYVYNRALTETEIKSINTSPYQIFNSTVIPYYIDTGGGGVSIPVLYHHYNQLRRG